MSSDDDTSSVSSGSTSSCVSTASQSTKPSTSDCRAIRLLPIPLFHPHAYSRAIRTGGVRERAYYDGARSDTEWRDEGFENAMLRRSLIASAAQAPYFERFEGSDGQTYLHRECIIAGFAEGGRLEVARLIVDEIPQLITASVLPGDSTASDAWNMLPLVEILHDALHFGQMHLLLLEDELLARLTAEIQYQRLRTDDDPVRPPFSLFYWRLDGRSALIDTFFTAGFPMDYVFRRTTWKDPLPVSWSSNRTQAESLATTEWPRPPPFRVYCSGNALMASMRRRVAQVEPAPLAAIARIRILSQLYDALWSLWTSRTALSAFSHASHAALLMRTHFPRSPYTALLERDPTNFPFDEIPLPQAPEDTVDTAGVFVRERIECV